MGINLATDLAIDPSIALETAITIQLRHNHYPPVPVTMVTPCIRAIEACNDGEADLRIELPEGVLWRGQTTAPAHAIVESHHLWPWVSEDQE
jgi:hypothetical protein